MSDTAPDFSGPIQASPEIVLNNETGLIDFSEGFIDNNGRMCQNKTIRVETIVKEPVVECVHKNMEKCHYTYITQFTPVEVRSLKSAETFGRSDNFPT